MSLDLKDFRGKITPESWCVLTAVADSRKMDMSELVREILDAWGKQQLHACNLMQRYLRVEGLAAAVRGKLGSQPEEPE